MLIKLIRNQPSGSAITGRLVIDGRWFCNTLERKGYEILALCYHVCVTQSPKFKRLLPLVTGVPSSVESCRVVRSGVESFPAEKTTLHNSTQPLHKATPCAMRSGIRFHRGTKPEHSTGCILVVADNWRGVELCRIVQGGVESCRMVQSGVESCRVVRSGVESCRIVFRRKYNATQLYPTATQLYPTATQLYPTATQLYPTATQCYPTATQLYPTATQCYPTATQLYTSPRQNCCRRGA